MLLIQFNHNKKLPTVILHGFTGSCNDHYYERLINYIIERNGSDYIKCIESGGAVYDIIVYSFLLQAKKACDLIKKDKNLKGDISIVGFSTSAIIGRYIVESCNFDGTVKRLISIGGPQMGIAKLPFSSDNNILYKLFKIFEKNLIFTTFAQQNIGLAGIYRNPKEFLRYSRKSSFLSNINNESSNDYINRDFIKNIQKLDVLVLIKFKYETIFLPVESQHFGYIDEKNNILNFTETNVYKEDRIGLKFLYENDKIVFDEFEGDHMQFTFEDIERCVIPYLK